MNLDLSSLDEEVRLSKPSFLDTVYYLFWEKGIPYSEFNDLPLPYIFSILRTFNYVKEEEQKAIKKARKR
jgi:hypothetical protein